jgi:PAS domain S-box-containing protein
MNKIGAKEIKGIYMVIGFITGLLITNLAFILILRGYDQGFTFHFFKQFHKDVPLFLLIDALPFAGLLLGRVIAGIMINMKSQTEELIAKQKENNNFIRSAIQNLTVGNLNADLNSDQVEAEIIQSLASLQERLKENRHTEKLVRENDMQRNWTSHGLAEFGDILRTHSSDRDKLAYAIISNLVRYLDINQGGFFIINQENANRSIDMIASHAYERNKFPDKSLQWGEGLIGAVAIEKKSYYTNKIPDSYLSITSGLGRANPKHLLIVPLVLNEEVFGVFELASFKEFKDYQIQFVERVAENTATTLNILYSNLRTEQLLRETQEQASQLSIQEEKVRQNINELKMTQAEAARQAEQFVSFTNTVNHTLIRAEYDPHGILLYANTRFLKKLGYSGNREVEGKHISLFIHESDKEWFDKIWKRLSKGGSHFEGYMRYITKMGQDLWTMATYTCVRKDDGSIEKILFLAIDSSVQKQESLAYEGQIHAIDKISSKALFSPDGRILEFNSMFEKTLKYSAREINNKNIFDFFARSDQERFNEIWEQVISGTAFQGQLKMVGKFEEDIWFRTSFTSIIDMYGEVEKIYLLAFDITKEKELEIFMRNQNIKLKEQEEEMKLQSMDLKNQFEGLKQNFKEQKLNLESAINMLSGILENHPLPVVAINNQGFVTVFNKSAEKYWGLSKKNILNSRSVQLFHKEQTDTIIQSFLDPGKKVIEAEMKKIKFYTQDLIEKEEIVSITKTESGSERLYTMIIHSI